MNRRASDETGATPAQGGNAGEEAASRVRDTAQDAADAGKERLEAGAEQAAGSVDAVAEAVGSAASRLGEMDHEGLADYANRLASWLDDMAGKLRHRNVDEITSDVRGVAERNPTLFFLGSVAVGLAVSRFARASGSHETQRYDGADGDARWTRGEGEREEEWTDEVATREFSPDEPTMPTYEGSDRGTAGGTADRPMPPDTSGGSGL